LLSKNSHAKPFREAAVKMTPTSEIRSHLCFAGLILIGALIYISPIGALGKIVFKNETYSHIVLIPLVSSGLLATHRKSIFVGVSGTPVTGFAVCAGGLFLYGTALVLQEHLGRQAFRNQVVPNDYLTLCMAAAVVWVIGSFIAVYGTQAFKKARFALLFLMFSIPLPTFLLVGIVTSLQYASAEASDIIFKLSGVSYHRNGLVFEFSNVAIQVADQCSGFRSSWSLFILSIITGYLFLRTVSRRLILAFAVFPIAVVKNALRIMMITLLANQVDSRFLTSHWVHTSGGIPFFAVALALLIPLVWMLRKSEARKVIESDLTSPPTI
jgi:exosortase